MKYITPAPQVASPIPMGVYDLDTLKTECHAIGIEPTPQNLRRIRPAIDLHQAGAVSSQVSGIHHDGRFYAVLSQTTDTIYEVSIVDGETDCDCSVGTDHQNLCEHQMAVMLHREQRRDQATVEQMGNIRPRPIRRH